MAAVTEEIDAEPLWLAPSFVVVLTRQGVVCLSDESEAAIPAGPAELLLLEWLASQRTTLARAVDEICFTPGVERTALESFAEQLDARGALRRGGAPPRPLGSPIEPAARGSHSPDPVATADAAFVVATPLILGLGPDGFEHVDHDGHTILRLDGRECAAMAALRRPVTRDEAYARVLEEVGPELALDEAAFAALVRRLIDAQVFRAFDPDDLAVGRGYDTAAESMQRERRGRRAVDGAMKRAMARLDRAEAQRRERTGRARVKVFPVHAMVGAWRNPPLSLGLIFAYAQAWEGGRLQEHFDFRPHWTLDEAKIDECSDEASIFMFSSYVWSSPKNLQISAHVKERNSNSITIHGGPDVPKYEGDVERYFEMHPHVDITVRGEGELTATEVLAVLADRFGDGPIDLSVLRDVLGISYRDGDKVVHTGDRERLTDLDVLPSPYLEGVFDSYVEGWQKLAEAGATGSDGWSYKLPVVVLETNRGCPYGCTFCDWGSATLSRIRKYSLDRIFAEIEWCSLNGVDTIGLADANFGIFERDVDITKKVVEGKMTRGFPKQFGTNYAKNTVKHLRQIVEELAKAKIVGFGLLSLQSMDTDTLLTIERSNIKLEKYEQLAKEFQAANLPLYVDLMVGLPGQTTRSFRNDLQECLDREVHAKCFPTFLLVNSPMNEPSYRERHRITAQPGQLVKESASFSEADYEEMLRVRRVFFLLEKFGVLRHVARYARAEIGIREVDLFDRLWDASRADPSRYPLVHFTLGTLLRYMVPPVSWKLFLDEVHEFIVEEIGVPDDDALETVFAVQHALLPDRWRKFPVTVELPHDYVAWHRAMVDAKYNGHLDDWPEQVMPLRDLGPGSLTVDDTRQVCANELGQPGEGATLDSWDLDSPVSRTVAVTLQN